MSHESESPVAEDDSLFARARAGDAAAWETLFQKCYPKVIRAVRRKLNRPMRSAFDSTDFASDVMKSLAAKADRLEFQSFESLMAFLAKVAEQKVIDEYRKAHALKRDIDRNRGLDGAADDDGSLGLRSADPTASQYAQAEETHEKILQGHDEPEQEVIKLKYQGYSNTEIAQQTGWNLRKVQRFIKDLQDSFLKTGEAS